MDFERLSGVVEELARLLTKARVERVYESFAHNIVLALRNDRKNFFLALAPDRSLPRLHLVQKKPPALSSLHLFTQFLKSRLAGARLSDIGLLNQDRVVEIRFRREAEEYRLLFELIGAAANLVITDHSLVILAVYHPVLISGNATRVLIPGVQYEAPPRKNMHSLPPLHTAGEDRPAAASRNREAEIHYEDFLNRKRLESCRAELRTTLKRAIAKTGRRLQALVADQRSVDNADAYRQAGDMILAHLNALHTGMKQAELTGYDGMSSVVLLDPKRTPSGNAEHYFKRYKKAKTGRDIIRKRADLAEGELSFLRKLQSDIESLQDLAGLLSLKSKIAGFGLLKIPSQEKQQKADSAQAPSYRTIEYQGWEILVGKSAAGNDFVTTKMAGQDDLWLHAEGMPGSHVLIRNPEHRDIPSDVLAKAASLAAFYSKGRNAGKVSITYTAARFVRKPKGAKPGLVTLLERKSIMAVPRQE